MRLISIQGAWVLRVARDRVFFYFFLSHSLFFGINVELSGGKAIEKSAQCKPPPLSMPGFTKTVSIAKYEIEQYARSISGFETISFISVAWSLEMFSSKEIAAIFGGFPHQPDSEGYLSFVAPKWGGKEDVPFMSVSDDLGDIVHGMFLDPWRWNGEVVYGCSDICSFDDLVSSFEKVTGRKSRFQPLGSWQAFDTHGVPSLEEAKNLFGMTQESGGLYFGPKQGCPDTRPALGGTGVDDSRVLVP
jgi:hypothetical protein